MGLKDTVTIKYLEQNRIFADVFNFFLYDGKPVIKAASLDELGTVQKEVVYGKTGKANLPIERERDVVRELIGMQDSHAAYLILAIEAQSKVHYAMPVKNMVYDALHYARQVGEARDLHIAGKDYKDDGGEFLSGFLKEDQLLPVVTVVIYFGAEEWDGPMSIHEMFSFQNQEVLAYVPDYKINLISPALLEEKDLQKFQTSMREVLTFIKYSKDPVMLRRALEQDPDFKHMGREEVNVLNACVNAKLEFTSEESEGLDVCEAIEIMKEEVAAEATRIAEEKAATELEKAKAEAARIAEEKAAAEREESEKNRIIALVQMGRKLMKKLGMTAEQAVDFMELTGKDRKAVAGGLN